jgi:pectin methylesterase-like acyl-CoA thioesterase
MMTSLLPLPLLRRLAALAATVTILSAAPQPLPIGGATTSPAPNATGVSPDAPLRLTFKRPPSLGVAGNIQIHDASTNAVVDTIDLSLPTPTKNIGGFDDFKYLPIIITGNRAAIYPRNGSLTYNKRYYVTIDAGVFRAGAEDYGAALEPQAWQFTTRRAPPTPGAARLVVAADGSGDFCTIQGALDSLPEGSLKPVTIFIRKGTYQELIAFTDRHGVTLLGEDRKETIIAYPNNAKFNDGGGNPFGGATPNPSAEHRTGHVYRRGVLLGHHVNDLTIANLTIRNTTPHGGSQAETIILNGTTTAHAVLKDLDLYSFQDTLQVNGQAYITDCHIEGDVDFMWGTGPCFFQNVTAVTLRSGAYFTQVRNPKTNHGYVFVNCSFLGAPGVVNNYLSRIGTGRFPFSEVVLIDCAVGPCVNDVGWEFSGGKEGNPTDPASVHFWEFNSHDPRGPAVDVSKRLKGSRQLVQPADSALLTNYRDPTFVLGNGWDPKSAPIFKN